MSALVFIPTFNEKNNIVKLISEIKKIIPDIFILVIDDSSTDTTGQLLNNLATNDKNIYVIHRRGIRGRGLSDIEAFRFAIQKGFNYIIEMDADFSHNPKYIPGFLEHIQHSDIVIGSRLIAQGAIVGRGSARNIISLTANLYARLLLGIKEIQDVTSGYRCYRVKALEIINPGKLISVGPSILEEILYRAKQHKLKIEEMPIIFEDRKSGKSKLNFKILFNTFLIILKLRLYFYE